MRIHPISPFFVGAALLAVACSRPADTAKDQESQRDIRLIEEPSTDKQTVSALEAGKTPPRVAIPEARSKSTMPASEPVAAPVHDHAAMAADLEPEATLKVVTRTESPAPATGTSIPTLWNPDMRSDSIPEHWNAGPGGGGSRGPMILIRGGMGTERDDCKIHGVGGLGGFGGGGIAINRVTPPFRSGGNHRSFPAGGGVVRIR